MRNIINGIYDAERSINSNKRNLTKGICTLISTDTYKNNAEKTTLSVIVIAPNKDRKLIFFCISHLVAISECEFTAYNFGKNIGVSSESLSIDDLIKIANCLIGQIERIPYKGSDIACLMSEVISDYTMYSDVTLGQFLDGVCFPDLTEEEISGLVNLLEMWDNEDTIEVGGYEYGVVQSCLNCGHQFKISEDDVTEDELGVYTVCPECEASFDI